MLLKTKYFGAVDCPDEERVHFAAGLFGFEEEKDFYLLPFEITCTASRVRSLRATGQRRFTVLSPTGSRTTQRA